MCVCLYHNSCEQTHSLATVGVRHHVSISNGEEGDGDEPHGTQKITGHILSIMVPEREIKKQRFSLERFDFWKLLWTRFWLWKVCNNWMWNRHKYHIKVFTSNYLIRFHPLIWSAKHFEGNSRKSKCLPRGLSRTLRRFLNVCYTFDAAKKKKKKILPENISIMANQYKNKTKLN